MYTLRLVHTLSITLTKIQFTTQQRIMLKLRSPYWCHYVRSTILLTLPMLMTLI